MVNHQNGLTTGTHEIDGRSTGRPETSFRPTPARTTLSKAAGADAEERSDRRWHPARSAGAVAGERTGRG
jgi:hypothetical protein